MKKGVKADQHLFKDNPASSDDTEWLLDVRGLGHVGLGEHAQGEHGGEVSEAGNLIDTETETFFQRPNFLPLILRPRI